MRCSVGAVRIVVQSGRVYGIGGIALEDRSGAVSKAIVDCDRLLIPEHIAGRLADYLTCSGQVEALFFLF